MKVGKLTVQVRTNFGKGASRRYRAEGLVPGICYGPKLEAPVPILVNEKTLKASLDPVKRTNTVLEVTVEGGSRTDPMTVMVKDWQNHAIRRELTHIDFVAIDLTKAVEADVPLHVVGKSKAAVEGGQVQLVRRVIPVVCTPDKIPIEFTFDVTSLDIGDAVHVGDLQMPDGVAAGVSDKLTIITVVAPKAEEEPVAADADGEVVAEDEAAAADDKKDEAKKD